MTTPAEHAATVREDSALLADWAEEPTAIANVDADSCRERIMYATEQLLVRAERANELERERDDWKRKADEYRIEGDHGYDDYEDAESVIRQIAEKRPNKVFDPWAVALCNEFLERPRRSRATIATIRARVEQLVTLVRIGFLVTVDGERATVDLVRDTELRALLMTILQAEDIDAARAALTKEPT